MRNSDEKRQSVRKCTVYKPARIELGGTSYLGLMTDVSAGGAGLTCSVPVAPGTRVQLSTGDEPLRPATVAWSADEHFGVTFDEASETFTPASPHNYRSVRVPTDIPAKIYVQGFGSRARIVNISPRGLAIETDAHMPTGTIFSLEAFGQVMENVTVRWCGNGRIGARLPLQIKLRALQALVNRVQPDVSKVVSIRRAG